MSRAFPERIDLPFGLGMAEWMPSPIERGVAWSLYTELNTQLGLLLEGTQAEDLRSARRCLDGIAAVVIGTRRALRRAGAGAARHPSSIGPLAVAVADKLRPFVERWQARLAAHEATRPLGMAPLAHEMQWPERRNFLAELEHKQRELARWSDVLAKMAGVERPEGDAPSRRRHAS